MKNEDHSPEVQLMVVKLYNCCSVYVCNILSILSNYCVVFSPTHEDCCKDLKSDDNRMDFALIHLFLSSFYLFLCFFCIVLNSPVSLIRDSGDRNLLTTHSSTTGTLQAVCDQLRSLNTMTFIAMLLMEAKAMPKAKTGSF